MFQLFPHVTRKILASLSLSLLLSLSFSLSDQKISKRDTCFRKSIPVAELSALTPRFLAFSNRQKFPSFAFCIETRTVSNIIKETCIVLKEILSDKFVKPPHCKIDWLEMREILKKVGICQTL